MNRLGISVILAGVWVADWGSRLFAGSFSTFENGCEALSIEVSLPRRLAQYFYEQKGLINLTVHSGGRAVWQGVAHDVAYTERGLQVDALGKFIYFSDVPYTALWIHSTWAEWENLTPTNIGSATVLNERFETIFTNVLNVTPRLGEVFDSNVRWYFGYHMPSQSSKLIAQFIFDYEFLMPTNWELIVFSAGSASSFNSVWGSLSAALFTLNGTGVLQTGTATVTVTSGEAVFFRLRFTGASATYTGNTGANYFRATNPQVRTQSKPITAKSIIDDFVAVANAANSGLNSTTAYVSDPGLELKHEVYEDADMGASIRRLVGLGDTTTPPDEWIAAVFEDYLLVEQLGTSSREWFVDVNELELQRSATNLINSAYAIYQTPLQESIRTANSTDANSVNEHGRTRRAAVETQTTSSSEATTQRDVYLNDNKTPKPRARLNIGRVRTAGGQLVPPYLPRAWDKLTIRSLPAVGSTVNQIRTFYIWRTRYDFLNDVLTVEPASSLPDLETYLARQGAKQTTKPIMVVD